MKMPRRKKKGAGFNDLKKQHMVFGRVFFQGDGPGYEAKPGEVTTEILADAEQYAADVTAEHIASRPGQRPWIWWVLHLDIPAGETYRVDHANSLGYLAEHDLLNTAERIRLSHLLE